MKKLLQLKLYSLLSTKWGMAIFVVGLFFTFNSLLQLLAVLIQTNFNATISTPIQTNATVTTVASPLVSQPNSLCMPEIDIVYTWVNGSDPRHAKALRDIKRQLLGELRPCNATEKPELNNCTKDEESLSRFVDNEELRYSMRSIEQFAPWVRNVYLVTNGQIPYWLNLSHPRLSVVTHEEIFTNHSHLPTFSSPAIECHIHRIPGLSKKFIYFNDDVMLGNQVSPEDWYTQVHGQKVYLAWAVPNCNDGCPPSWVGDGYCDVACNVSSCNFDGGDCRNWTGPARGSTSNSGYNWNTGGTSDNKYCSPGCPDGWIGDKYCDRACRNVECGMDAGDCEMEELFSKVTGVTLYPQNTSFTLPSGLVSVYFNLSNIVGDRKIVDGNHDNAELVRTATISQKYKTMTLTLHRNVTTQMVSISVVHGEGDARVETVFNITTDTLIVTDSAKNVTSTNMTVSVSTTEVIESGQVQSRSNSGGMLRASPVVPVGEAPIEPFLPQLYPAGNDGGGGEARPVAVGNNSDNSALSQEEATRRKLLEFITQEDEEKDLTTLQILESNSRESAENPLDEKNFNNIKKLYETVIKKSDVTPFELDLWISKQMQKQLDLLNSEKIAQMKKAMKKEDESVLLGSEYFPMMPGSFNNTFNRNGGRKLLDMYGDSLKFANSLFNSAFGSAARKVPAHMPHMIDRDIVQELMDKWPAEFGATSSHQLRSPRDMQYAFSYFYFVMSQKVEFNITDIWTKYLDVDKDGILNDNEIRTLAAYTKGVPIKKEYLSDLKDTLLNSSRTLNGTAHTEVTLLALSQCEPVVNDLKKEFGKKHRNKFEVLDTDEVAFVMIGTNATNTEKSLDGIRLKRQKFVCLNDNINHSNPHAPEVVKVMQDFYKSLYPLPSSFELPSGVSNPHLYIDEMRKLMQVNLPSVADEAPMELDDSIKMDSFMIISVMSFVLCSLVCIMYILCCRSSSNRSRHSKQQRFLKLINV